MINCRIIPISGMSIPQANKRNFSGPVHVPSLDALPTASIRGIAMFFGASSHNSCLSGKYQVPTLLRVRSGNDAHEWQGLKQAAGSGPSRSPIQRLASIFHLKNCDHVFFFQIPFCQILDRH